MKYLVGFSAAVWIAATIGLLTGDFLVHLFDAYWNVLLVTPALIPIAIVRRSL